MSFELEMEFWFSENADQIAEEVAATGLPALVGRLEGLKPFPQAAAKLMKIIRDPNHSTADVVRVIEGDPGIASRVLRTVNSAAFSLPEKCNSIQRGCILLGSKALCEIATAFAVLEMFQGAGKTAEIRSHSLLVANFARRIAAQVPRLKRLDVFTAGLLHDLGKLLILQVDKGEYARLLAEAPAGADLLHERERGIFGYDHAILGGHILKAWKVPAPLPHAIAWHHQGARALQAGGEIADIVATVRLADRLSYELTGVEVVASVVEGIMHTAETKHLGLDDVTIQNLWSELAQIRAEASA